jgi:hypothetical protein
LRAPISILASLALASLLSAPTPAATDVRPAVVAVTGTVVEAIVHNEVLYDEYLEEEMLAAGGRYRIDIGGPQLIEQTVAWSDPRLPAKQWLTLDYHNYSEPASGAAMVTTSTTHLLEDESGRWTGQGRFVAGADEHFSFYTLRGEGAYEGLYALLHGAPDADEHLLADLSFEGYILEGELPGFPLAPTPVTTTGVKLIPPPTEPPTDRTG